MGSRIKGERCYDVRLIVGLGNPGQKYAQTRHNIGFHVIDSLAGKLGIKTDKIKFKSLIGEGTFQGEKILLMKPQTFMNLSGEAVFDAFQWYKLNPEELLVIYDDMDLPLGKLRLRVKGSAGGHKGMKSIIFQIQSDQFPRLRIGIGRPTASPIDPIDFVVGKFSETEAKQAGKAVIRAADAVLSILEMGVEKAMNQVNRVEREAVRE